MKNSIDETAIQGYPELEPEVEGVEVENSDARPVSSQPNDWNISTLRDKHDRGHIELQPHYQREYVWELKPELPSRLVESFLLEIPVPPIYFGKMPGGRLEVIDGQQRLTTLIKFVRNEFHLQRLQSMPSLNGKYFRDMSEEHQEKLLDAPIRSIVIDAGNNQNLRYEIFERLNRGSMGLNEQELRNCVYRGPFCDLLTQLEKEPVWRRIRGTDKPEPRFVEREMILRFFAFANRVGDYKGKLKSFLNDYMGKYAPKGEDIQSQANMFRQAMQNVWTVFGTSSARLYTTGSEDSPAIEGRWEPKFSISALDIQASALMGQNAGKIQLAAEQIREMYVFYLLTQPQIRLAISRQPAGTAATKLRWTGFKTEVQKILDGTYVEPRFFSLEFRHRLFDDEKGICGICHCQIHDFDDSTVDHIHPYSRGGKTVRENAQLAHRSCNARKAITIPPEP